MGIKDESSAPKTKQTHQKRIRCSQNDASTLRVTQVTNQAHTGRTKRTQCEPNAPKTNPAHTGRFKRTQDEPSAPGVSPTHPGRTQHTQDESGVPKTVPIYSEWSRTNQVPSGRTKHILDESPRMNLSTSTNPSRTERFQHSQNKSIALKTILAYPGRIYHTQDEHSTPGTHISQPERI
ncbi:hypothetical protein BJ138DRAFT_1131577 [Hygrophoropsis aurantiaca]|uniref:Uncharacterized protein n=1 Tax=Hygrophoropsis aurantiaca TaxID=72124 RepID=A0ACB7ZNX5_9AGAM|nr:hypothetical protein BJ138DRAFT_1131577 [Hygrophoropsis aurantiaca]